jgi:uncharacterized BrkB/YihY/UPF0761 family membrane protein
MLAAAFLAFAVLLKLLPRGRVRWGCTVPAAAVALVLWELARSTFGKILLQSPAFGLLTGALAGIVAFLVWIYTAVAICLFGAEIAAVLNGNRS